MTIFDCSFNTVKSRHLFFVFVSVKNIFLLQLTLPVINSSNKLKQQLNNSIYVLEKKLLTSDRDRFFNCILDFIFILVAIFIFTFLVVIIGNIFQWDIYRNWEEVMIRLGISGTFLSFAMFYYLILESFFGRTIGKIITGSTVVNKNGLKPGFSSICKRTLCRLIPFDQLSFLGKSGRIWHDSLSNTYVVEKKDLEKDMEIFYGLNLIGKED